MKDYAGAAGLRTFTAICGCGMALIALSLLARHAQWRDDFDLVTDRKLRPGALSACHKFAVQRRRNGIFRQTHLRN